MEGDAQGTEGTGERSVDFLAVTVKSVEAMLVGVVGGSNDVLEGFEHGGSRF